MRETEQIKRRIGLSFLFRVIHYCTLIGKLRRNFSFPKSEKDVVENHHSHQECGLLVIVIAAPNNKTIDV